MVERGQLCVHFDGLIRVNGKTTLRKTLYEPVLFHALDSVREEQKLCLALGAYAIGKIQGVHPTKGVIIFGEKCSMTTVRLMNHNKRVFDVLALLLRMLKRKIEPTLSLNQHCNICPFCSRCQDEAIEKDDLSRLGGSA